MSDYNQFVLAVNKIFEITAKLKSGWKDQDNINTADSVEESKSTVIEASKLFNTQVVASKEAAPITLDDSDDTVSEEVGALE